MTEKHRRLLTTVVTMSIALGCIFASGSNVYAKGKNDGVYNILSNGVFSWSQGTEHTRYIGPYSVDNGNWIHFEGVATAPTTGTFTVKLQRKIGLIYFDTGNTYTVTQQSGYTTNLRTGDRVVGQFFRLTWAKDGNHDYRIVFSNANKPQNMTINQVWFYSTDN